MNREVLLLSAWVKKRRIMRRYDLTADMYEMRYREEQEVEYRAALKHLTLKNALILDVGCGTGLLFSHVSAEGRIVCGIDFSRKTLVQAKKRAENLQNVHVVLADVDHLPLRENVVTVVFAFTVAQNVPNPLVTLREMKNIVCDNAKVVFTGLKRVFTLDDFKKLLSDAGLKSRFLESEDLQCYVAVGEFVH